MEVVPLTVPRRTDPTVTVGIPFNKRNVEEWSRLDRLTGMMETAKIETDHWSARSINAAHKYGKMIDSRERNNKDGTIHESQRKQMEVFQTQVPGGSMQVIRTQTVTTSSKSSKWVSNDKIFNDLQLPINSLDLSSQKTKGSVGRSGSIGGRRPPSRPRSLIGQSANAQFFGEESSVSKLCHQIHEKARSEMFKPFSDSTRMNGFNDVDSDSSNVIITDITDNTDKTNSLYRRKSCSNENVANDVGDDDALKRSSKVRRSLQFPKTQTENEELEWSGGKSLKERAAEIENLLKRGGSTTINTAPSESEKEPEKVRVVKPRDSFVSADTLKEVRERLKKSNSDLKDDGIVTDSKVKCFVFGMETMNKANINGTGSLESRSSCRGPLNGSRSAEWYRRRKSYGFEDVDESDKFNRFNRKSNIESSTDSGICQSSETIGVPTWSKSDSFRMSPVSTVVTVRNDKTYLQPDEKSVNSVYLDNPTICSIRVEEPKKWNSDPYSYNSPWNRKSPITHPKNDEVRETLKSSLSSAKNPWISQLKGTKLVDRNWAADEQDWNEENEKKTIRKEDTENIQKKSKRVEFCKTEVHFAAESGKFNIVETDGKPPPNDIFRRRRRHVLSVVQKNPNGLPETKFGDSVYEKKLLTSEKTDSIGEKIEAELKELSKIVIDALPPQEEKTTEFKKSNAKLYDVLEEETEDTKNDSLRPRSILKNNYFTKPKEECAGGSPIPKQTPIWRPPFRQKEERTAGSPIPPATQVWKSTVILRNKRYDTVRKNGDDMKLYSSDGENELQVRIRNLRKTDPKWWEGGSNSLKTDVKRRSLPDDILLKQVELSEGGKLSGDEMPTLSVAERIKKVEELKSNIYSSKINFRSGEMTVVQNGSETKEEKKKPLMSQNTADPLSKERPIISCDNKTSSNPSVMRSSTNKDYKTDNQKYQTTRILINFESQGDSSPQTSSTSEKLKTNNINKTTTRQVNSYGSWSSGMKKDLNRYFNDLKSTTLVRETIHSEEIPKPSKSVHEIIDQFDSLSSPKKVVKERRRRTMPINYKAPKEYTQADLEEELKNFTENLDKDFRDIYEEEIGSARKKSQEKTAKKEDMIRPVITKGPSKSYGSAKSFSDVSSQKTSSKLNYNSDDSDLLADEEVRSYMSTGLVGTDSDPEDAGKVFDDPVLEKRKEIKNDARPVKVSYEKPEKVDKPEQRKVALIALKYEDDPLFVGKSTKALEVSSKPSLMNGFKDECDHWEKTSNSSSTNSNKRERNSYLNVTSLSEMYSKYFERSSNSSLDQIPEYKTEGRSIADSRKNYPLPRPMKEEQEEERRARSVVKSHASVSGREKIKNEALLATARKNPERRRLPQEKRRPKDKTENVLEELTKAADQILIALNDYDDSSFLASSEDDEKTRKVIRKNRVANLGTISEGKRITKTETRRASTVASARRSAGTQSSASSLESLTRESHRRVCPKLKQAETPAKPLSSRATRLLQRATTRQASMPQPSSSEDLPSYIELAKKRSLRRQRSSASVKSNEANPDSKASASRIKPRSKTEMTSSSRTREKRTDKVKESTTAAKSMKSSARSSRTAESERSKSCGRRIGTEKIEDLTKRKLSSASHESAASTALQRKKPLEKWKP